MGLDRASTTAIPISNTGIIPAGGITTSNPTMGTTEDRHTIRITGIERIPVTTVIICIKPRWAQSARFDEIVFCLPLLPIVAMCIGQSRLFALLASQDRARMRIAVSPTAQMPIHHRVILDAFVACHPAKGFSSHGCGGARPGAKVGNGVAVGAGVAVAAGIGVATCACAPAKKVTKPTRTHTLTKAFPDRIRVLAARCRS